MIVTVFSSKLAAEKKLYHAAGALDAIATALYDMRKQIVDLQVAYREEIARQAKVDDRSEVQ